MKNDVKFLRRSKEFNMTQHQLAEALGVNRVTISSIENGSIPSGELMLKIAIFFKKDPREIFFLEDVA